VSRVDAPSDLACAATPTAATDKKQGQGIAQQMQGSEKIAYVKFIEPETYRENGRHIFAVLNAFTLANYQVCLCSEVRRRLQEIFGAASTDWPPPARLALALPDLKLVDMPPPGAEQGIYIFDTEDRGLRRLPWRKRLRVKFDLFSAYRWSKPIIMPYAVHPMHADRVIGESLDELRATSRKVRILFAGDLEGYKRRWLRYPQDKLSRQEIIATIKERLGEPLRVANSPHELAEIMGSKRADQFVLVDNDGARIAWSQWMDMIAQADFFLCPPGIVMPMCHNIIEAMAIGTIPITNYPEWFAPKLEHMKNCIVFDGKDDLLDKIKLALTMSDDQMAALRDNAMRCYEQNLVPQGFVAMLEARPDKHINALLYSEYNVAKNAAKLNGGSVLMRGEEAARDWAWLANAWR
jgi:hypothetical protein